MADKIFNWCSISLSGRRETSALPNARFPYWSFTKTVIAICALKLSEAGVIDLDAPLAGEAFTLRQLLMHTAGLNDYAQIAEYHRDVAANQLPWPRERLLEAVLAQGPLFTPGNGWCYSNVGYMLAREHIEAVSGKPFAHWVAEFISLPLELHSVESRDDSGTVCHTALEGCRSLSSRLGVSRLPYRHGERRRVNSACAVLRQTRVDCNTRANADALPFGGRY
ncbi:serine hydrolase [Rouxiella badensis]|nr:serine hydrolase [Rouxiella badensis]